MSRLEKTFFNRPCLTVARELVGKILVRETPDGTIRLRITETEAYCGESDTACHAHKGKTKRTEVLYASAGTVYVYLCYGMHWMLNLVTGEAGDPQAVLIRGVEHANGPGRLTKALAINGTLNWGSVLTPGTPLWVEDDGYRCGILEGKRIGIGYASREDQDRLWRFTAGTPLESS